MRGDILLASAMAEKFYLHPSIMGSLQDFIASGFKVDLATVNNTANSSATMQVAKNPKGNIAIINIDGAMYKKDMSGMCMSIASYQKIQMLINEAEVMYERNEISKLIFRVSTPGGAVHGVDALEDQISKLQMPTITFAEDMMCSAGVYAFMATDKVVLAPMTEIGSIGVVSQFIKNKDQEVITITSSRASNKRLDLTKEEDQERYRKELDVYEDRFYSVVQKNTNFTAEQIEKEFNNGGTIFADKALEIGFVDEVMRFEELLEKEFKTMGGNDTAVPVASSTKVAQNSNTGANDMEFTQENFNILLESREHLNGNIKKLNAQLEEQATTLEATQEQLTEATARLSEAQARQEDIETRVMEAIAVGADADTAVAMMRADSAESASKLANEFRGSEGASTQADGDTKAQEDPWANFNMEK